MFTRPGITLIELVMTLAILAVLTVLVVPNLGKWIQHYRIRGTVREIVSQMELAKIKALKSNLEYRIAFDSGAKIFRLERGNMAAGSSDWSPEGGEFRIPRHVTMTVKTTAHFNPHGTGSGSLDLSTASGEQYHITVNTTTAKINTKRVN